MIVLSILGSIGAMFLQRYVIIVATAFGGAWTVIVGGLAVGRRSRRARKAASAGDVWILYPTVAGAGTEVGADRVDRARADRHRRAAGAHGAEAEVNLNLTI